MAKHANLVDNPEKSIAIPLNSNYVLDPTNVNKITLTSVTPDHHTEWLNMPYPILKPGQSYKYLGIHITPTLDWTPAVDHLESKLKMVRPFIFALEHIVP